MNLIILVCCVLVQGFFSGSEMVILSSNQLKLRRSLSQGSKGAKKALEIMKNPSWYLATTSTGTNISVIIASVTTAVWLESAVHTPIYGEMLTIVLLAPILLIFGEIIPRTLLQQKATELAPKIALPLWIASRVISPVTVLVFWASRLFYNRKNAASGIRQDIITKAEIELALKRSGKGSDLKKKEKKLIRNVFLLSKSNVEDIMVPLIHIAGIPDTSTIANAIKIVSKTGHSRLPVFKDRVDNLIGIIHAFDLIGLQDTSSPIKPLVKTVPFVPELKRTDDLLVSFQKSRDSIAIVVDEYGGAVGIITIEDILEEVVGEICDEHDQDIKQLSKIDNNTFLVKAGMEIEDLNDRLKLSLPKEDYETIGGFLLKQMGKIPAIGETFKYKHIMFTIKRASARSIHEIIIRISKD
jgi:CBS domain containing-hemolysin-like protein